MSALASRDHGIMPRSDFLSIDQKITFEMDNIEEKLQRMLQSRADAIDRELQERWPTLPGEGRAEAGPKDTQRHCLQRSSRAGSAPPRIEVAEPRLATARLPSNGRVIDAFRDAASLDRALTVMRMRVGASPRQAPSLSTRLWALVSRMRTIPGAIDWWPLRSFLAGVLERISGRGPGSPALMTRVARWSGGKHRG